MPNPSCGHTCHQVGIAQQWYDELDNLAFSEVAEEPTSAHGGDDKSADQSYQDQRRVQFTCAVNVSPGTCEVQYHLKPKKNKKKLAAVEIRGELSA